MVKDGTRSEQDLVATSIRLTTYHKEKAQRKSKEKGMSVAQFIRFLIEKA